jgi:AcrR family transcriptional regulator
MTPRIARRARLDREQVVAAALALIDEHGIEGHSMRTLGARLGVDASTLYYHVPSKAALHSMIVDAVMAGVDLSADDPSHGPAERLIGAAGEFRRVLMLHPRAVPLVAARSLRTPTQLAGVEVMLGVLYEAGFSTIEAMVAVDAIGQTVIGMTGIHAAHLEADQPGEQEPFADLPADRFPNLRRMVEEGAYLGFDAEFDATVAALVHGLLARHDAGTLLPAHALPAPLTDATTDIPGSPAN